MQRMEILMLLLIMQQKIILKNIKQVRDTSLFRLKMNADRYCVAYMQEMKYDLVNAVDKGKFI